MKTTRKPALSIRGHKKCIHVSDFTVKSTVYPVCRKAFEFSNAGETCYLSVHSLSVTIKAVQMSFLLVFIKPDNCGNSKNYAKIVCFKLFCNSS